MALIIIADDDELVVGIVRSILESRGHIVGELSDGKSVKQVVELKQPDVVILDCAMEEVSGIVALKQIRASKKVYKTPVMMLTARRGTADERIAWDAGADDYLRKPFDPDDLVARVEALVDRDGMGLGASIASMRPSGISAIISRAPKVDPSLFDV
ncbi:MAG: response regulator transcription factor [Sphingomicrobium sp.]